MNQITFRRLLCLVNAALWNKKQDENLFRGMTHKEWTDLYHFSIRHAVLAIAFDGVLKLPSVLHPPLKLRMAWAVSTEQIEQKYERISDAAEELNCLFKKEGMEMLIFKGLSLSDYYPVPAHREFGDIDIYLRGKHPQGDLLLDKVAVRKEGRYHYKHSNYYYKDIMIENHAYLLDVRDSSKIAELNGILLNILQKAEYTDKQREDKLRFPPVNFTALFFIVHAVKHLSFVPLQLRTYCDWALFLQAHVKEQDTEQWRDILSRAGLLEVAETITALTMEWMQAPVSLPFTAKGDPQMKDCLSKEMLRPFYPPCKSKNPCKVFVYKFMFLKYRCKRYSRLYARNFYTSFFSAVYNSFVLNIASPKKLLNIK